MKYSNQLLIVMMATLIISSCKKSEIKITPLASLNLVNATVNATAVKTNFTSVPGKLNYFNLITTTTAYGANTAYAVLANTNVGLAVALSTDSTKLLYNNSLNFVAGGLYTLYLAGQTTAVDTILVKENIPSYTDSVFGFRVINLSYNSTPVNVTLTVGTTVTTEFSNIAYKSYSNFKSYQAKFNTAPDTIRVRDAATNTQLAQYVFIPSGSTNATTTVFPRFFNCTLAFIGQIGGSGANVPKLVRINNY